MAEYGSTGGHVQVNGLRLESVPSIPLAIFMTFDMLRFDPDMRSARCGA